MIIEVTGASTRNKGAELMLAAVREHYGVPDSDVTLAVTPWFGSSTDRLRYNLATKLDWNRWGRTRLAMSLAPEAFRRSLGVYENADLDAALDISGFAFGDQHPAKRTIDFADRVENWKGLGKKVALLPQAFGPFENTEIRNAFGRIVDHSDLICPRDQASLDHIVKHFGQRENVLLCPDITIGIGSEQKTQEVSKDVLFVPNTRMLDKSDSGQAGNYIPLLQTCIRAVRESQYSAKILLHDAAEDRNLVPRIQDGLEQRVEVIQDPNPLSLKHTISQAALLVGSRFHSLVSALSSGVPVLATGWSHKYEMLLNDFGCPESVLNLTASDDVLRSKVESHLDPSFQSQTRDNLVATRTSLKSQLATMWQRLDKTIGWESPCG